MRPEHVNMLNLFGESVAEHLKPKRTFVVTTPNTDRSIIPDLFAKIKAEERKTFLELTLEERMADLIPTAGAIEIRGVASKQPLFFYGQE